MKKVSLSFQFLSGVECSVQIFTLKPCAIARLQIFVTPEHHLKFALRPVSIQFATQSEVKTSNILHQLHNFFSILQIARSLRPNVNSPLIANFCDSIIHCFSKKGTMNFPMRVLGTFDDGAHGMIWGPNFL